MEGCTHQLDPLLRGEPVILSISDPRLRKKKRVTQPMLIIHPFSETGEVVDKLLFSFPGYGCELIPVNQLKADRLYMMGLTYRSARLLTDAVKQVFSKEPTKVLTHDHQNETQSNDADPSQSSGAGSETSTQEPDVPPRRRRSKARGQRDRKGKRSEGAPPAG